MNESIASSSGSIPDANSRPEVAYRQALRLYDVGRLRALVHSLGGTDRNARAGTLAAEVVERLEIPAVRQGEIDKLGLPERITLGLFGITETSVWSFSGLSQTLRLLDVDPESAVNRLLATGLLAERPGRVGPIGASGGVPVAADREVVAHPAVLESARTALPEWGELLTVENVRLIRESDGLEPILRLAALWQRVAESPLRQTQNGSLYKRDRDRIDEDPTLAGPIADMIEPVPDMAVVWLDLARGVGLIESEAGTDRLIATGPTFWDENAVHLPQMIAARWLALRNWDELWGRQEDPSGPALAAPYVRPAVLLWLAALPEGQWIRLEDLAALLDRLLPNWESPVVVDSAVRAPAASEGEPSGGEARPPSRKKKSAGRRKAAGSELLSAVLGGMAYQLGLVRVAEADPSGDRVVQLSDRGRYVLRLGPFPSTGAAFDAFLYVQPNLEIIAYRQGLTPNRIGLLSRFTHWSRLGAALELRLTAEDTYRGLEAGLTVETMLERLSRHSARPLGANVGEAIRTWANRRERLSYYMAATLIEFTSPADLQNALESWDEIGQPRPVVLTERLVLVEDDAAIPLQRLRMLGSRDYRRPPEACVSVENDGVTLVLDPSRGDLFADAELARFADEVKETGPSSPRGPAVPARRYRVTRGSLARAKEEGYGLAPLSSWFERRTGAALPPAIRLLLEGLDPPSERPVLEQLYLLRVRSAEILDGLAQHPATRELLQERLGPCCASVRPENLDTLRFCLHDLGLDVGGGLESGRGSSPDRPR